MLRKLAVLIVLSPSLHAATMTGDLSLVHRVAIRNPPKDRVSVFQHKLLSEIPGITIAPPEQADLVVEYSETEHANERTGRRNVTWNATLVRLDCQSPEFGVPPTKPWDGTCDRHVYVRAELGSLSGDVGDDEDPADAFVAALEHAILFSDVRQSDAPAPVVAAAVAPLPVGNTLMPEQRERAFKRNLMTDESFSLPPPQP
jgi:hypothetical protein